MYFVNSKHIRRVLKTRLDLLGKDDKELCEYLEAILAEILTEEEFIRAEIVTQR